MLPALGAGDPCKSFFLLEKEKSLYPKKKI
jgi:hypothetical protein